MPTQTKPPCILGASRCDAVDWLDVCLPKKTGPMEWTCITKQQFLNVGHTSDVHARIWIWAWAFAHETMAFRRIRDCWLPKCPKALRGKAAIDKGKEQKKRWATSLAREWQKMGQHEGGSTISITVRTIIGKTLAVELEEGKPHILIAIWHHLLLVVHSLNRGGTS